MAKLTAEKNYSRFEEQGPLSVKAALTRIISQMQVVQPELVGLLEANGRILARDVNSFVDSPAFSNSGMDGFAVIAADTAHVSGEQSVALQVVGDIPAGKIPTRTLLRGQAMRIMTGAPIPQGADAVVPVEQTDLRIFRAGDDLPSLVQIFRSVQPGDYVRAKGQDIRAGEGVLQAGVQLRPQDVGLLAMIGVSEVPVFTRIKIGLISSGDELIEPGQPAVPGKIFDSNLSMLIALLQRLNCDVVYHGTAADDEMDIARHLDGAVEAGAQALISTAGVSVGAFDFVRNVIEKFGHINLWRVNMRPGKPLAFGDYKHIPFWGLPGNPVSAFVGFEVFVKPALIAMAGYSKWKRPEIIVDLGENIESDGRESYLRAEVNVVDGRNVAVLTGHQGSGNLFSLVKANAFIIVPSEVKSLPIGSQVKAWMFDDIG